MSDYNNASIEDIIEKYGFVIHKTQGVSMLPMLEEGRDLVRLVKVNDKSKLKKYDLPLFEREDGALILHRIIEVRKNHYITCGDNCKTYEKVPFRKVLAVAEGYFKEQKYISCNDEKYINYVEQRCKNIESRNIYRPISKEQRVLVLLFSKALSNDSGIEINYPIDLDWEILYKEASRHNIAAFVFPYINKGDCPEKIYIQWKEQANMVLRKEILFDAERQTILKEFESNNIDYILLKGIVLKNFYPMKGVRDFTDNDILTREEDKEKIRKVMEQLGYTRVYTQDFADCPYHKAPIFNFEMHMRLFSENMDLGKHFKNIWENSTRVDNSYEYKMKKEDFYFYIIAHFNKHYKNGGAGLKFFADVYFMQKALLNSDDFDNDLVIIKLKEAGLLDFVNKCNNIIEKLLNSLKGKDGCSLTDFVLSKDCDALEFAEIYDILSYVLYSGAFGSREVMIVNQLKEKSSFELIIYKLFPPRNLLACKYTKLKKYPFLLPFYWIKRLFATFFSKNKRRIATADYKMIKKHKTDIK